MLQEELNEACMRIIAFSGQARAEVMQAAATARSGDFAGATTLLAQADTSLASAQQAHLALLAADANDTLGAPTLLVLHAQDHLNASLLAHELVTELVLLSRRVDTLEKAVGA